MATGLSNLNIEAELYREHQKARMVTTRLPPFSNKSPHNSDYERPEYSRTKRKFRREPSQGKKRDHHSNIRVRGSSVIELGRPQSWILGGKPNLYQVRHSLVGDHIDPTLHSSRLLFNIHPVLIHSIFRPSIQLHIILDL
jgi:hypothetical protein